VTANTAQLLEGDRARGIAGVVGALIFAAALLLPFTGLGGIAALGEMKGSASTYVLVLALPLYFAFCFRFSAVPQALLALIVLFWGWIAVSAVANFDLMSWAEHGGRSGREKFLTSILVLGFGTATSIMAAQMLASAGALNRLFLVPLAVGVMIAGALAVPELLSWTSAAGVKLYNATTGLFQTESEVSWRIPGRLSSVSFEAPDLSYYSAMVLPWLLLGYRLARIDRWKGGRLLFAVTLCTAIGLLILSNSRTGVLMAGVVVGCEFAYWVFLRNRVIPGALFAACFFVVTAIVIFYWLSAMSEAPPDDVSTMSRLGVALAQFSLGADHLLFGVGWGQYGFHADPYLPAWAWESFEIRWWFDQQVMTPPSFSVPGRLAAELGVIGFAVWYGFWLWIIARSAKAASLLPAQSVGIYVNGAILASAASLLVGGVSTDCFRRPETWLLIGIMVAHVRRNQRRPRRPEAG
jgi:hypothetical protein